MPEAYYQTLTPHNIGSPVITIAATHVSATVLNFYGVEYHTREVEWGNNLVVGEDLIRTAR